MLLVVMTSVAYLVLPRGRMCPRCGGYTSPVMLRRMLRVFEHWVQWRWCSRCAWEGPGRKGPALGLLDPPADHESGFRWGHPNLQGVPVFYWRDEHDVPETSDPPPVHPSGFRWSDDEREGEDRRVAERRQGDHPSGFRFRARGEADSPGFQWGPGGRASDAADGEPTQPTSRPPWLLSWLASRQAASKQDPGFQWRPPRD